MAFVGAAAGYNNNIRIIILSTWKIKKHQKGV